MMSNVVAQVAPFLTSPGLAAAGLAAVSVPIAIHLMTRMRRRPQMWGAMRFVLEAYRKQRTRLQLEQWLLLLARCLILALLGLALAGPLVNLRSVGALAGADAAGRLVVLVVDDSLAAQATPLGETSRFEELRTAAVSIVESLGPADRVALCWTARPHQQRFVQGEARQDAVLSALREHRPRYTRGELAPALESVSTALEELSLPSDRVMVVVLSPMSPASLAIEQPVSAKLKELGERATLAVLRPMAELSNVQVSAFAPRRQLVLADPFAPTTAIPVEATLRRFVSQGIAARATVDLSVLSMDPDAPPLATTQREVQWSAGQTSAVVNLELRLPAGAQDARALGVLPLRFGVSTSRVAGMSGMSGEAGGASEGAAGDSIEADNAAYAVVEIRQRLAVAVVDDLTGARFDGEVSLSPRQWLTMALEPAGLSGAGGARGTRGVMDVREVGAKSMRSEQLEEVDAAVVLRPDLLEPAGWEALGRLAARGGLVWIIPPDLDLPAAWGDRMAATFDLPWQLGLEAITPEEAGVAGLEPGAGWPLAGAWNASAPQALDLLAADWEGLLRPVRVQKRLPITLRAMRADRSPLDAAQPATPSLDDSLNSASQGAQGDDDATERVAQSSRSTGATWLNAAQDQPLMVVASVGEGQVVLLGTALSPSWTNLPLKPLFVPLMHETLRALVGGEMGAGIWPVATVGDQPVLGRRWIGASALEPVTGPAASFSPAIAIERREDELPVVVKPIDAPGLWRAQPSEVGALLGVNVDAAGGDTAALSAEAVGRWFDELGEWQWLDGETPASVLEIQRPRANLGWPLLWVVLSMVLIEMMLARWASHVGQSGLLSWVGRGVRWFKGSGA